MRLTTVRAAGRTRAGRVEGDEIVLLDLPDIRAVFEAGLPSDVAAADGERISFAAADLAPMVTQPEKIVCVGVNYADHISEMGREAPSAPTYFAKYSRALIGPRDQITLPPASVSTHIDWECELVVVIGSEVRNASRAEAQAAIGGFTILNDVSVRDWQRRTSQFLAGKTFEGMTPLGPVVVTADELGDGSGLAITTTVDGVIKQQSNTSELVFDAPAIVADLSTVMTLVPGDVIATGTPGGVGAARTPPEWLQDGSLVVCAIEGIGELRNQCR
jgi:acylpyruvate hydrolase